MANWGKKWGGVIACWCVALALMITGICLGLTIPSSAADEYEGEIAVMFDADGDGEISDDETQTYHTMQAAIDAVNACATAVGKEATIQLRSDVTVANSDGHNEYGVVFGAKHVIFDLNGHYLRSGVQNGMLFFKSTCYDESQGIFALDSTITFIDNNPTAVHYCSYGDGVYQFTDYAEIGEPSTPVYGGVIAASNFMCYAEYSTINFQAGIYVAKEGGLQITGYHDEEADLTYAGKAVIENGVAWQVSMSGGNEILDGASLAMWFTDYAELEINGGNIYGEVAYMDNATGEITIVNLDEPQFDAVKVNANMKAFDINGVKVYSAVAATPEEPENPTPEEPEEPENPTPGQPITPTEPIVDAEPTNNDNNLIGLIILGVAAAVMVVGVTTIIIVSAKRNKRQGA